MSISPVYGQSPPPRVHLQTAGKTPVSAGASEGQGTQETVRVPGWPLGEQRGRIQSFSVETEDQVGPKTHHSTTNRHVGGIHDEQRARVEPPTAGWTGREPMSVPARETQR